MTLRTVVIKAGVAMAKGQEARFRRTDWKAGTDAISIRLNSDLSFTTMHNDQACSLWLPDAADIVTKTWYVV